MPDVSPTPATAPAAPVAAPPFTGREDGTLMVAFACAALNRESGRRPDGSPRWAPHPTRSLTLRYVQSGLTVTLERTTSALDPYVLRATADALTVSGYPSVKAINVKIARSGTGAWARLCEAALVHAVRHAEANERAQIEARRIEAAWDTYREALTATLATLPAATRVRGLTGPGGEVTLAWNLAPAGDDVPAFTVGFRASCPMAPMAAPLALKGMLTVGLNGSYGSASRNVNLADLAVLVRAMVAAQGTINASVTPSEGAPAADAPSVQ